MPTQKSPLFAAASFLCLALGFTLLIQCAGQYADISLVRASLPVAAALSFFLTYGHFFARERGLVMVLTLLGFCFLLWVLGMASLYQLDLTSDGMGYQQPSAEAILNGWNPLHHDAKMLWQNIYPSGAWELEASLAALYGSIEAAKALQFWWLLIAAITLLAGLRHYKGESLLPSHYIIALLVVVCPLTITQAPTHYVDAMLYYAGVTFVGALLLTGADKRQNSLAFLLMGSCILFIVNAKLSGIYHAVVLCIGAVMFIWMRNRKLPILPALFLVCAGLLATLVLGFHPYVTNFQTYGSLLHMDAETFAAAQRPANLTPLPLFARFFYSLFSTTGGGPQLPAILKYPFLIFPTEWAEAGAPDSRTGGFGVFFALAAIGTYILLLLGVRKLTLCDTKLLALSALLFVSSLAFPESWWARYVPFAYLSFLLVLLAIPKPESPLIRTVYSCVIGLLLVDSVIAAHATYNYVVRTQEGFVTVAKGLQGKQGVYLVPPGFDYEIYNGAYIPITRRLKTFGINVTDIKIGAPCPHQAMTIAEFKICY